MKINTSLSLLLISIIVLIGPFASMQAQDTIRVITHHKVIVQTNPKKGFENYHRTSLFPSSKVNIRRIILHVTLQCPDNLMCGEWDYADGIYLINRKKNICPKDTIEISRILTPYGRFYGSDWKFTFQADITEFAPLLRDSVEIYYTHSGYEARDDRGWKLTLDFEIQTGKPAAICKQIIPLWNGNFTYGDSVRSIEADLKPVTFSKGKNAYARLWMIQTGHGMDETENCAEFCYKYRDVYFDSILNDRRVIKKECASNPLYHQAGTWIYDRANWCPGDMVQPECYTYMLYKDQHKIDINMQPYIADTGRVSACYSFASYLFLYEKPANVTDASLHQILVPSDLDMYSHENPSLRNPSFIIKNNGSFPLITAEIKYGFDLASLKTYHWKGLLTYGKTDTIVIDDEIVPPHEASKFYIAVQKPNGKKDEYPHDNMASTKVRDIPVFPNELIFSYRTNNDTANTSWKLLDVNHQVIAAKSAEDLSIQTSYADTLTLKPGYYELLVSDTAGDGLEFWANPEGGMGYFRIKSIGGDIVKVFQPDFGNEIKQVFYASDKADFEFIKEEDQIFAYPQRTKEFTNIYFLLNEKADVYFTIKQADKILLEKELKQIKEHTEHIDLSQFAPGIYQIEVNWNNNSKKIRIKILEK